MPSAVKPGFRVPPQTATVGMWLFLASLAMLFFSGMIAYVFIRWTRRFDVPLGSIGLPWGLWASTLVVIAASVTIHRAVAAVRLEKQKALHAWLIASLGLAVLFCLVQLPCLWSLLSEHFTVYKSAVTQPTGMSATNPGNFLYAAVFFYILVHGLHVAGGIVALGVVTVRGLRGDYDHESYGAVKHAAMYWHFLDVVWLVMFGTMLAIG